MALARFDGTSDVYVFECVTGLEGVEPALTCCGCGMTEGGSFWAKTGQEMIDHLRKHQEQGDRVPSYVFAELDDYEFLP